MEYTTYITVTNINDRWCLQLRAIDLTNYDGLPLTVDQSTVSTTDSKISAIEKAKNIAKNLKVPFVESHQSIFTLISTEENYLPAKISYDHQVTTYDTNNASSYDKVAQRVEVLADIHNLPFYIPNHL